jgi:serine/threonine protein phosphatase PrpC
MLLEKEIKALNANNSLNKSKKYIVESIKGLKRKENQDNYLVIDEIDYCLYFVFDGVGNALNSKKATVLSKKFISKNHGLYHLNGYYDFSALMFETNKFLIDCNIPELKTTYCSVFILNSDKEKIQFSSLGDSRVYIINPQYLEQVTKDDKYLSSKNTITKCLGMEQLTKNDFYQKAYPISAKDQVLLCTDGFYNLMENEKSFYFQVFHYHFINTIKNKLRNFIKGKNIDDCTFILIK